MNRYGKTVSSQFKNKTMKDVRLIKQFRTQIENAKSDNEALKSQMSDISKKMRLNNDKIEELTIKIKQIEGSSNLKVSEHAVIRYLERVKGIDLQEVESEILNPLVIDLVSKLGGNGSYPIGEFQAVFKNNVVVTIK